MGLRRSLVLPHPTNTRRFTCALLAIVTTFSVQSLWLGGLDHDAALTISAATAGPPTA
jgi:hypothetical protein